jgi:hypothetical protein
VHELLYRRVQTSAIGFPILARPLLIGLAAVSIINVVSRRASVFKFNPLAAKHCWYPVIVKVPPSYIVVKNPARVTLDIVSSFIFFCISRRWSSITNLARH